MTTNSPNPVDGDLQALIERLNRIAARLKWNNVGYAQDVLKAVDLLTAPPAQLLRPVELPESERLDGNGYGYYFDMDAVFVALDKAGVPYEVKS